MMEVAEETTYVRHHKRKIAFILSAMRHHADALRQAGWTVDYHYDNDAADALPARLTVSRGSDIELRLRIEEWSAAP
jgi:deoxyribodipyrimidine photolyase-like uncharacterized protein